MAGLRRRSYHWMIPLRHAQPILRSDRYRAHHAHGSLCPGALFAGFRQASWGSNVTVTFEDGRLHYVSDGLPNHERDAEYALPNAGVRVPDAATATAGADPTVATASNFSVKNASGQDVFFLDDCAGHPTPMGQYHYHALPKCVTATVDEADGPSHIIGIAFDGYPIYGDRDIDGKQITAGDLDKCNGITSATPEFPEGVYHYVLLDVADSTSSIRCFTGVVSDSLASMTGMPGMLGRGGPPPPA